MADKKVVGLDFTTKEIRMAQISYGRGLPKVERVAIGPIPDGVFSGGKLVEPVKLAETIKELLKGYRFTARRAVLGISGKYGVTRMLTLPRMTAAQTRDAINLQLNQYVPFPPADTLYDFKTLREIKTEEQPSQEVLLVATRRSSISPLLKVVKSAGLTLIGIKITTLASFGIFEDLYKDSEYAVAFVDVRDSVTDISFVAENYFRLSRSIEFGLINLTERIRTKLGLNHVEAVEYHYQNPVDLMESYRPALTDTKEQGIAGGEFTPDKGKTDPAELDRQLGLAKGEETTERIIRDAILRSMGQLVNELMRSIRYYESQARGRARVGRVVMFGYVGGLTGMTEYLGEQTGLDITVVKTLPGVESTLDSTDEAELKGREAILVVPIGLGVEGAKAKKIDLNLIPREAVYRRKSFGALKFAVVIAIIVAAILANLYIQRDNELKEFQKKETELTQQIASIQHLYDRSQEFKQYIDTVKGKLSGVVTLAASQPPWPVIVDELGRIMRDKSWIDEFHWDANGATCEFHGFCFGTDEVQMLLVNMYHSSILSITEVELDPKNLEMDEGVLGGGFGGTGFGGGGFGFSSPGPSGGIPSGADGNAPSMGENNTPIPGMPQPMYRRPGGAAGDNTIEWYFQFHEFQYPIFYEFTASGTIKPEVMTSGKKLFTDAGLGFLGGGGPAAPPPLAGASAPAISPGGPPSATPGDTGGDGSGDEGDLTGGI
ncbi:MAG: type IV pilus assembly protein PilM [bacterium]|nr:type IV pilus assembly protein PilM [bacterium]